MKIKIFTKNFDFTHPYFRNKELQDQPIEILWLNFGFPKNASNFVRNLFCKGYALGHKLIRT